MITRRLRPFFSHSCTAIRSVARVSSFLGPLSLPLLFFCHACQRTLYFRNTSRFYLRLDAKVVGRHQIAHFCMLDNFPRCNLIPSCASCPHPLDVSHLTCATGTIACFGVIASSRFSQYQMHVGFKTCVPSSISNETLPMEKSVPRLRGRQSICGEDAQRRVMLYSARPFEACREV